VCTLIVAWQVFEEAPICVAANRDEVVGRPSSPPAVSEGDPAVLAPRDERAGGTWLGYNEDGLLVAVTNRWVEGDGERSRGRLIDDALEEPTASAALDCVEAELADREYAPFHLLVADGDDCILIEHSGHGDGTLLGASKNGHAAHHLDPGIHIIVNVGFDGEWFVPSRRPEIGRKQARNAERVREELQPRSDETAAGWTRRAGEVLGTHEYGVCIHSDGFGTRSSSLVRLGEERVFEFADGPPCETAYERVEEMI
jgi:uncharacterized protein with NRDE domain